MRDKYREQLVDKVMYCFDQMGATSADLKAERNRLMEDDPYLDSWIKTIDLTKVPEQSAWEKVSRSLKLWLA